MYQQPIHCPFWILSGSLGSRLCHSMGWNADWAKLRSWKEMPETSRQYWSKCGIKNPWENWRHWSSRGRTFPITTQHVCWEFWTLGHLFSHSEDFYWEKSSNFVKDYLAQQEAMLVAVGNWNPSHSATIFRVHQGSVLGPNHLQLLHQWTSFLSAKAGQCFWHGADFICNAKYQTELALTLMQKSI